MTSCQKQGGRFERESKGSFFYAGSSIWSSPSSFPLKGSRVLSISRAHLRLVINKSPIRAHSRVARCAFRSTALLAPPGADNKIRLGPAIPPGSHPRAGPRLSSPGRHPVLVPGTRRRRAAAATTGWGGGGARATRRGPGCRGRRRPRASGPTRGRWWRRR